MAYEELFKDVDFCRREIVSARKIFGSTMTTKEQYEQMEKALSLMLVHCPDEMTDIVEATISEAWQRRFYYEMGPWQKSS